MADDRRQSYQSSPARHWSQRRPSSDRPPKRGLNRTIHLAVKAHGMPAGTLITEGAAADCSQAAKLIEGIDAENFLADKAYDVDALIKLAMLAGMSVVIPPKRTRKVQREYDKDLYKLRVLTYECF